MTLHARETPDDGIHGPYAWTFADATARAAFTPTSGYPFVEAQLTVSDLNKWALDLDTGDAYRLTSLGPTTWTVAAVATGSGNVSGPGTSTDNAVARFNGTDGELIQESGVIIDDSDNITGVGTINGVSPTAHGTRHNPTGSDPVTTAAAVAATVGQSNSVGTANSLARSDHTHEHAAGTPVNVTKAANSAGVATTFARSDHKHDVTTAAPTAAGLGTTSGEGSATTLARSDHTHQANTAPANVTKAAAAIGTSTQPARADHKHDVTTATAVALTDSTNAEGASTSLARADHTHAHGTRGGGTLHAGATTSTAGFMSATDKQKVDLISLASTMRFIFSIDGHSSNSEADQGFNNGHPSIIMRGSTPTQDPEVRWSVPFGLPGYTSGTGVVRILFTTNVSGGAGDTVIWRWGWRYADDGDDMDPPNDEYSNNGAFSHDVSAVVEDTMTLATIDTIGASEMAELAAADIAFFRLSRESQSNAADDFDEDVYVHGIWIEYTGNVFAPGHLIA